MTEFIERFNIDRHTLWTFAGDVQPASFIFGHLRRRGLKSHEVNTRMRLWPATYRRKIDVPLVKIMRGTNVVGYRISTWRGERTAVPRDARAFLRREGYTPDEILTLQALARVERIKTLSLMPA